MNTFIRERIALLGCGLLWSACSGGGGEGFGAAEGARSTSMNGVVAEPRSDDGTGSPTRGGRVERKIGLSEVDARSRSEQVKPWASDGYDPCERAYDINVQLTQNALTAFQQSAGLLQGPAASTPLPSVLPKPEFLSKCNSMPFEVRRCMDLEYQFENAASCEAAHQAFVATSKGVLP
ncbi:MAG: hypothetical protein SFV15_22170 [Polyangiaceae bacterium]|nr:hypothetical protein [Polyangiaceae bacterium]